MNREMLYNDLSGFLAMHFPCKVQKISINAGFTCPNRDGSVGYGGCTYCNNQTFNPAYCHTGKSVTQQLEEGKRFFVRKYPEMKYLAYFQAYTNTYGELEELKRKPWAAFMWRIWRPLTFPITCSLTSIMKHTGGTCGSTRTATLPPAAMC